jgi:cell division GTPase FtsZ
MTARTSKETIQRQEIEDNMTNEENTEAKPQENEKKVSDETEAKLAALKAKFAAKEEKVPPRIVAQKEVSIRFGVVGSGQAGSRLAEALYKLSYPAVVINTARQDLADIDVPETNKLLLEYGLGGAAKDLSIGHAAAEAFSDDIKDTLRKHLRDQEIILFCTSLGGGSGAGSSEVIVDILVQTLEVPVVVLTVLPQASDDTQVKHNALQTLSKFAKMVQGKKIANLIVADNAKIESVFSDVSPFNFFKVSNQAIVNPIDVFNTLSTYTSAVKPLDSNEFAKLFLDGQGLTVYGTMKVSNYEDEMAIAQSLIENLGGNLLASGFDTKQARYAGFMLVAPSAVWEKIPSSSLHYANSLIDEACANPRGIFRGIYAVENGEDCITVYSMFSGLGLPTDRVEQLKNETKERMAAADKKDNDRNLTLKLDVGESSVSAAEDIKKKIAAKKSAFGMLHGKAIDDRRKR